MYIKTLLNNLKLFYGSVLEIILAFPKVKSVVVFLMLASCYRCLCSSESCPRRKKSCTDWWVAEELCGGKAGICSHKGESVQKIVLPISSETWSQLRL